MQQQPPPMQQQPPQQPPQQSIPPPMMGQAPGMPPKPTGSSTSVDDISKVLASMTSQDLFTLMTHMKVDIIILFYNGRKKEGDGAGDIGRNR